MLKAPMHSALARFELFFGTARAWWAFFGVLIFVLLIPLFITEYPPLADYPNHLARIFILAHPDDPFLSRIGAPHWSLIPNLALDLIGPPLIHVLPVSLAGRVLIALAVLPPVIGVILYARATSGVRSYWPFAAA